MKVVQRPLTIPGELNQQFNNYCRTVDLLPLKLVLWLIDRTVKDGLTPEQVESAKQYVVDYRKTTREIHTKILLENHRSKHPIDK